MAGDSKPHILFICQNKTSFVNEDLSILSDFSVLHTFTFPPPAKRRFLSDLSELAIHFLRQFLWLVKHIRKADLIYIWFADFHATLPVLFGRMLNKPVYTVIGGFDANRLDEIGYGVYTSRWRRPLATWVIRNSRLLLPVDETLIRTDPVSRHWPEAHPNGLTHNIPSFNTPYHTTPTGYDPSFWPMGPRQRGRTVTTVALCRHMRTVKLKGIDLLITTARLMPDVSFTVVGVTTALQEQIHRQLDPPDNVTLAPAVPREELISVYHASSVYLQLSLAEGLPNVLCEAMMCGCLPVGSAVFGIPAGIGTAGYIAEKPDPDLIRGLIYRALDAPDTKRGEARKHIEENYSLNRRRETLLSLIAEI